MVKPAPKPGRNDPCHCGSGNKYQKCCLAKDEACPARPLQAQALAAFHILASGVKAFMTFLLLKCLYYGLYVG